jgi:hypothetical protein
MPIRNTINFLPESFRSSTNQRFLGATLDHLTSDAINIPVNGYIGRTFAPTYKLGDNYVPETNTLRANYQLEPSVVIKNANGDVILNSDYVDLLQSIANLGGHTSNHQRLFESQAYNYDGHFDYDKFVNYNNYYWMPNGPDAVIVSANQTPYIDNFTVTRDTEVGGYTFSGKGGHPNSQLTLARGGTYTFNVNQPGNKFWIQTESGVSGTDAKVSTVSTRNVFGVSNNGTDNGTITFNVPLADAQDFYTGLTTVATVSAAVDFKYTDIQNQMLSTFLANFPNGLDGLNNQLNGKTFIFVGNYLDDAYWTTPALPGAFVPSTGYIPSNISPNDVMGYQTTLYVPPYLYAPRTSVWQVNLVPSGDDYLIQIKPIALVRALEKVSISSGNTYAASQFWLNNNYIYNQVPAITAGADYLYYQDSNNPDFFGEIKIVDNIATPINIPADIIGRKSYPSPNGVVFTNGLKVTFDTSVVPADYAGNTYYVEGVGTSIDLVPVEQLVIPEQFANNVATTPDYITINRASQDHNPWSRYNRWFHKDVLFATAKYNNTLSINYGPNITSKRPIIEFEANLQLYNFGIQAKPWVDLITFDQTNAFATIEGQTNYTLDGTVITDGMRIVFANDYDVNVSNLIWQVNIEAINGQSFIRLISTNDDPVLTGENIVITKGVNAGNTYWFNGTNWNLSQAKTALNQAPLFDIVDINGYSFSDTTLYPSSTFAGTKFFGYEPGTGPNDTILGFPLSYKNFNNIGDIVFTNYYDNPSYNTFTYTSDINTQTTTTVNINSGYLIKNSRISNTIKLNNWIAGVEPTEQYQIISSNYAGYVLEINQVSYPFIQIDVLPDTDKTIPYLKVYLNNVLLPASAYSQTRYGVYPVILFNVTVAVGDKIDVAIFSSSVSNLGYYQVPENLDFNPLNDNFDLITLGQIRNHYSKLIENTSAGTIGIPVQDNYLKAKGGTLLQHSSPLIYSMTFLTDPVLNFQDSVNLARKEYTKFKNKFISLCSSLASLNHSDAINGVDIILKNINSIKNSTFPWYYSDMVPQGANYTTTTYTVLNARQTQYEIGSIFDSTKLSNRAVIIYYKPIGSSTAKQLTLGTDYTFSTLIPAVNFTISFTVGDVIAIRDYLNTDGNYIPETPSKLGLYPKTSPSKYLDTTYQTPTYVIRGHDGSITPAFNDFRDNFLLELEQRIYNNIKASYNQNYINLFDTIPGRFRTTDYSLKEWNTLLTNNFLSWIGSNSVDYATNQWYDANNPWTWNYDQSTDLLSTSSATNFLQGSWRAIYQYWYDTTTPNLTPWEMLGFGAEPSWWATRYGPAPYTSGNTVLWEDLEVGYIWNDNNPYTDSRFARPGLAPKLATGTSSSVPGFVPSDLAGNLLDPTQIGLIQQINQSTTKNNFVVGEQGPVETAWRRSSDYPFAIQHAIALARPAQYFSTQIDTSRFSINVITGQFSDSANKKITPTALVVNGDTTTGTVLRTSGYINWITDNVKNLGIDSVSKINNYFTNFDVQLAYKVGGFTDQNLITVRAEQTSPGSTNASIIIPNENYKVYIGKPVPVGSIKYSAVIVTKTSGGYSVSGYDTVNPFFVVIPSKVNSNVTSITVDKLSVKVYKDGTNPVAFAYGTTFKTPQQLADFLVSYQRYLVSRGLVFESFDTDLNETRNWELSIKEFLFWVQQGWANDTIIVLNPIADSLKVRINGGIIDEVTNLPGKSRLLDNNFAPIKNNAFDILRTDYQLGPQYNQFTVTAIDGRSTIAFALLNIIKYENTLIFDNVDDFGDIIYVPSQGTRQYRLKLDGSKTGAWTGAFAPTGYIYSNPTINQWQTGTDYKQGDIVLYNNSYYTAPTNLVASQNFALSNWTQIPADAIQTGLIPSFAHNAQVFQNIYDVDNPPQDQNYQIFSAGLLGFRERPFLSNLGLSIPTQTKFYQGYISQKGTINSVNALTKATFDNVSGTINTYEEWAFQVGTYGDINNNPYTEFVLDQSVFLTNPVAFTLTTNAAAYSTSNIIVNLTITGNTVTSNVYNASNIYSMSTAIYNDRITNNYFADLPTSGYVNLNDIDIQVYDITSNVIIANPVIGNKIWVAKDNTGNWNVYRITEVPNLTATNLKYTLNSYAQLSFDSPHLLSPNEFFILKDFDNKFDGLYKVISTPNQLNVVIVLQNPSDLIKTNSILVGTGKIYTLNSMVVNSIKVADSVRPPLDWVDNDRLWVNNATPNGWGVYSFNRPWYANTSVTVTANTVTANSKFGSATAVSTDEKWLYVGNPGNKSVQVFANVGYSYSANLTISNSAPGFGATLDSSGSILVVGAPTSGNVNVYQHTSGTYTLLQTLAGTGSNGYGTSIALSRDAHWLYIGEPGDNNVYAYWTASTTANVNYTFVTGIASTGGSFGSVVKTNLNGNLLYVGAPSATNVQSGNGNVYVYSQTANAFSLVQTLSSQVKGTNSGFGTSIAVDALGGNLFVGIPGSAATKYHNGLVERYVYSGGTYSYLANIVHPDTAAGAFGTVMSITSDAQVLTVTGQGSATEEDTTFDNNATVIDNRSTKFVEMVVASGAVYMFEPLIDKTVTHDLGSYSFTQYLAGHVTTGNNFGASIATTRDLIMVGATDANNSAGVVHVYNNPTKSTAWTLTRQQQSVVDINSISRTFIYNKTDNIILSALDYIDPAKGKIFNVIAADIDYQLTADPAYYNAGTGSIISDYHWGPAEVGKIWWDIGSVRYINYEQDSLIYRLTNWGVTFPGSQILVYEWVESTVPPSQYTGDGIPLASDDSAYSTYGYVSETGVVNLKYYFWVKNKTAINADAGKSNSVYSIAAAIQNPQAQGIPYATVLRNDTLALYNVNNAITGKNSVLHLGTKSTNSKLIHSEYALVQEGNPLSDIPAFIERKLIDSLAGQDSVANPVPDPALTASQTYGINIRPRQTMFVNRSLALDNYITFVNNKLIAYPVVQRKIMTTLNSQEVAPLTTSGAYSNTVANYAELGYVDTTSLTAGYNILVNSDINNSGKWAIYTWSGSAWAVSRVQSYKTNLYWAYTDWHETGYDYTVEPDVTVANNLEFGKLTLVANTYVKVLDDGAGNFIVYYIDSNKITNLVGIQNGTVQFSTGTIPGLEMRQLALAVQNDIFIDDLAADYNRLFFTMIKYALTEQKNLDWVFKTNFLTVTQHIRALTQFPSYIADNQQYYLDYINEVKPYRTVVRQFVVDYQGNDQYGGDISDFDLPPYWDANVARYRSPSGELATDTNTLDSGVYTQWSNNYQYKVVDVLVENAGTGYNFPPQIGFESPLFANGIPNTTGTANGYATLNGQGGINQIVITNPGYGYTFKPNVIINGEGSGAVAYSILRNVFDNNNTGHNLVRSIGTTIKFDRINYQNANTFVNWTKVVSANVTTNIGANTIIVNNNILYVLESNYLFDPNPGNVSYNVTFPLASVNSITYGDLDNANDRIIAINGNIDLSLTQTGIDYPGVIIDSNTFVSNVYDTRISSLYSTEFGVNPGDILVDGGAYVGVYGSHAPEELIPGRMYDSLNITVYDTTALAFRQFKTMNGNLRYYRIASLYSSNLSANLYSIDSTISVENASVLPAPNAALNYPGVVFINGEKIVYWRNYATETPTAWAANLALKTTTLVSYNGNTYITVGNVFDPVGNIANVASSLQQVNVNTLGQIRRGADGTYTPRVHVTGSRVISADKSEIVPVSDQVFANIGANAKTYNTTSNVSYALHLISNITANVGDYITQKFTSNSAVAANLFVLGNVVASSTVPVIFVSGNLTLLSNTVSLNGTTAGGGVARITQLGSISANGNAVISANTVLATTTSWYTTGESLYNSYTPASVFLINTPGFVPTPGTTP